MTELRTEVEQSVTLLRDAQERIKTARDEVVTRQRELQVTQSQLADQHAQLTAARQERAASLAALQARESDLEEELGTSIPGPGERASLVGDTAVAPPNAPLVVKAVIEAANEINDTPYVWGGGHGSFTSSGYDCSGAVSYALHGGGLLSTPLDSGGFTGWGSPGRRQLDHRLRQLRPRLHVRRRPALGHLGRRRTPLALGPPLELGLHRAPPLRVLAPSAGPRTRARRASPARSSPSARSRGARPARARRAAARGCAR